MNIIPRHWQFYDTIGLDQSLQTVRSEHPGRTRRAVAALQHLSGVGRRFEHQFAVETLITSVTFHANAKLTLTAR